MKTSHAGLEIGKRDFLITVTVLQQTLDARGLPFSAQTRLLALLAPMHRDIITR